ncbi:hypothetical protein HGA91_06385 [candidate division WWE3 bacterium]|nr:hypothetical protein [candidate division WWE3 bacterium]
MTIYFTASIAGKRDHPEIMERYKSIVDKLRSLGHEVLSDHVLQADYDQVLNAEDDYRVKFYRDMLNKINKADLVFAEMSVSSASIGHEVTIALEKNKPVIIASESGIPQIFKALQDHNIYFLEYKGLDQLLSQLEDEIESVKEGEDIRFNFLIPPTMVDYLEWVSKSRRIPKSVFIRDLVKREMLNDEGYQNR